MKLNQANAIAGSIGYPSKMPGTSYGIPAAACITGSILRAIDGSTCNNCYAFKNNYNYNSVQKAQATRLAGIKHEQWVESMVLLLEHAHGRLPNQRKTKNFVSLPPYHRWHDSGDIQSREHLAKICAVARATPWLMHWLPSREAKLIRDFVKDGGTIPANLVIRLSATMVDGPAPKAWPLTSTVHNKQAASGHSCPARFQDNKCGECRACWDPSILNVSYHIH